MGWSIGYDSNWQRDIGYGVPAYCDHPGCKKVIDRGFGYVCGDDIYGGEHGCGLFFCAKHMNAAQKCVRCAAGHLPFNAKEDHPRWMQHKITDESWEQWRRENPEAVRKMKEQTK